MGYTKYIRIGCTTLAVSSMCWMISQIKIAKDILSDAMDLSVLNILENRGENILKVPVLNGEPEYIDINYLKPSNLSIFMTSFRFIFAQKLIGLCHSDINFIRKKALIYLSKMNNLDQCQFSLIASMIDKHTAVCLARLKNVDIRLFKEPPVKYLKYNDEMIIDEMKNLLLNLSEMSRHSCLQYFVTKAFFEVEDSSRSVDSDTAPVEMSKIGQTDQDLLPICLESLLHHASFEQFGKDLVKLNALPLLSEIHNRFRNSTKVNIALCRIISYLSFHVEVLEDLHTTGWIGILAEWTRHEDLRISIPAVRALANLENTNELYMRYVYLLHPSYISNKKPKVDIIFVHGLLGGVFYTWRQRIKTDKTVGLLESLSSALVATTRPKKKPNKIKSSEPHTMQYIHDYEEEDLNDVKDFQLVLDDLPTRGNLCENFCCSCNGEEFLASEENGSFTYCWPRDWLAEDCDKLRIIGVNYDTTLSKWNTFCPHLSGKTNIEEQSLKLMSSLLKAGVGTRPIVWITHSMGGLLVKNILNKASCSTDPKIQQLVENTKGIVFYSTPHLGSNLATFNSASQMVLRLSIEVRDLREKSPFLIDIHNKFLNILQNFPIKVITFVETKKTFFTAFKFNFQLVTPESGNTGIGEYYEIPLDHLGICKPVTRFSFLYRRVLDFIKEIVEDEET